MAIPCTVMRSGALQAVAHRVRRWRDAPCMLGLCAMMTMLGVFTLAGCYISRTIDQATASDLNNRSFTFANGAVFHPGLANASTTLSFTNNATNFTLSSAGGTAVGTNRFDSCILTVANSNYNTGAGPQVNEVITLDPCDFDSDNKTLTVSRGNITVTSAAATAISTGSSGNVHPATASDVNNRSFTFANGAVFHTALTNVQTVLAFPNNATNFTLTSAGAVSGTASGTSSVAGSCSLTVTSSDYRVGPQRNDIITLNPCTFNSTNNTLIVTNSGITVTSGSGTVIVP